VSFARTILKSVAEASSWSTGKKQRDVIPRWCFSDDNFLSEIVDTNSGAYFGLWGYIDNLRRKRKGRLSILFKGYINVNVKM